MKIVDKEVNIRGSSVGDSTWIRLGSTVENTFVGNHVFIGFNCLIYNAKIMNHVQIASNTQIGNANGDQVLIESAVWLGAGVRIKAGVTIGEGSVIGAETYVENNIEPYSVVVGNPGKVIKSRDCVKDSFPVFNETLEIASYQEKMGRGIHRNTEGNYITADINAESDYKIGTGNILIGKNTSGGGITIGNNVSIGDKNIFEGFGSITLGDNVCMGNGNHILSNGHDYTKLSMPRTSLPVVIDNNVFIGDNVTILGGLTIPRNTRIDSNMLVIQGKNREIKLIRKEGI